MGECSHGSSREVQHLAGHLLLELGNAATHGLAPLAVSGRELERRITIVTHGARPPTKVAPSRVVVGSSSARSPALAAGDAR